MRKIILGTVASLGLYGTTLFAADLKAVESELNSTEMEQKALLASKKFDKPKPLEESKEAKIIYDGFSYIGFGTETVSYIEQGTIDGKTFKSSASATSPVYMSGSLIRMNEFLDLTIDAASTLLPTQTDEKWQYDGYVEQKNKFDSVLSNMKFMLHFKMNDNHRLVFGPAYDLFSMKRHTYINAADGTARTDQYGNPIGLNEERVATLYTMGGYWYEHAPHSSGGMRIKLSALYGAPVWREATNTSSEEVSFNTTNGYKIDLGSYIGFEIIKGLEFGLFAEYNFSKKEGADTTTNGAQNITWPDNELEVFRYGISFVWNFSKK